MSPLTTTPASGHRHSPYASVDPAPPAVAASVAELRETLLDTSCSLFVRYRALFALRDNGGDEAVLVRDPPGDNLLAAHTGRCQPAASACSPHPVVSSTQLAQPSPRPALAIIFSPRHHHQPPLTPQAIVDGLGDKSALFRHEIAYVLGQMQHPLSVDGLSEVSSPASSQSCFLEPARSEIPPYTGIASPATLHVVSPSSCARELFSG